MKRGSFCLVLAAVFIFLHSDQSSAVQEKNAPSLSEQPPLTGKAAAEKGDSKAQLEYGKSLLPTSRDEARVWLQKAAQQGQGEAWFLLGGHRLGDKPDVFYYEKAAENGYQEAFNYLLDELLFRAGASADVVKAKKYADLARERNVMLSYDERSTSRFLYTIDQCYEAGTPIIPDSDRPLIPEGADNNEIAEMYANGRGVKRSPKLAIALVCHGSGVPAELERLVYNLGSTQEEERLDREFKFCDHVTSVMNIGMCAAREEEVASKKREAEFAVMAEHWSSAQKVAFKKLRAAADDFILLRADKEIDHRGHESSLESMAMDSNFREEFFVAIRMFESGQLPNDKDFKRADKDLNEAYSRIMRQKNLEDVGTVTRDGIRATQRKWIKYRDAWTKFAGVKYPGTVSDIFKVWLTQKRTEQLKEFVQ
jgi:Lysozyme inhibitor LprI/Sel1 repeat